MDTQKLIKVANLIQQDLDHGLVCHVDYLNEWIDEFSTFLYEERERDYIVSLLNTVHLLNNDDSPAECLVKIAALAKMLDAWNDSVQSGNEMLYVDSYVQLVEQLCMLSISAREVEVSNEPTL